MFSLSFEPAKSNAGSCYADAYPKDLGGGAAWDKNYVIDVSGDVPTHGIFVYRDYLNGKWYSVRFSAQSLAPDQSYTRFGVSTRWAYLHPGWLSFYWRYTWSC